ncbi:hypothetical protein ACA910_002591 [Epithemia clementina (nom. ined.)]
MNIKNPIAVFAVTFLVGARLPISLSLVPDDGICSVFVFTPFTTQGGSARMGQQSIIGFSQMASALMAEKQFNSRDPSVVPQLADLDCDATIQISNASVFDTAPFSHLASQNLVDTGVTPCAIVGPYTDDVAWELSAVAQAAQYPIVVPHAQNLRLAFDEFASFTASVFPDLASTAEVLAAYLNHTDRTNYIAMLFELTDTGTQRREMLDLFLGNNIEFFSVGYDGDASLTGQTTRSVLTAMEQIRASGFRTIVIAMHDPRNFQRIADAAEHFEMNNGDHFYVWYDVMAPFSDWNANTNASKLVVGSAWIFPLERYLLSSDDDPFLASWKQQGSELVDRVNAANPIEEGNVGYEYAEADYFQKFAPEFGAGFMFDAVMSVGLAACNASRAGDGTVSGLNHRKSILNLLFSGATGTVEFGRNRLGQTSTRSISTAIFGTLNILPDGAYNLTSVIYPGTNMAWNQLAPFQYANGGPDPPYPLRDPPTPIYISTAWRVFGLSIMSLLIGAALASIFWVFKNRKHRIVASSQPLFLYIILFGTILQSASIVLFSFDEGEGWSEEALTRSCMALPWLLYFGHTLVYMSLFTKLWRVHKVLQFSRRRVEIKQLLKPMIAILVAALGVLTSWTVVRPLQWERRMSSNDPGESVGFCESEGVAAFVTPLVVLSCIPTMLTGLMAYKTRDVDSRLAESFWIFTMILIQGEAVVIGTPTIILMRDQAAGEIRYAVLVVLISILPLSTMLFLMIPKLVAFRQAMIATKQSGDRRSPPGHQVIGLAEPKPGENNLLVTVSSLAGNFQEEQSSNNEHKEVHPGIDSELINIVDEDSDLNAGIITDRNDVDDCATAGTGDLVPLAKRLQNGSEGLEEMTALS